MAPPVHVLEPASVRFPPVEKVLPVVLLIAALPLALTVPLSEPPLQVTNPVVETEPLPLSVPEESVSAPVEECVPLKLAMAPETASAALPVVASLNVVVALDR